MKNRSVDVIVAGYLCLDIIPEFFASEGLCIDQILVPGKAIQVGEASVSTGGPVSNTGIALSKLDHRVALISKVGDDEFGRLIMSRLESYPVNMEKISISRHERTGFAIAISPPGIDRLFLFYPGTNRTFGLDDIDFSLCKNAKLFHFGYPPLMRRLFEDDGNELVEIFRCAKETGIITSLDMALPDEGSESSKVNWPRIISSVLPYVDIFQPGVEEALFLSNRNRYDQLKHRGDDILSLLSGKEYTDLSSSFLDQGAKIVTFKSGYRGFYLRTGGKKEFNEFGDVMGDTEVWSEREIWSPALSVETIATATGSGDAAIAGFLAALLHKQSPERAVRYAVALGYQNLLAPDALSGIEGWNEVTELVDDTSRETLPLDPVGQDWNYSESMRLWFGPNDASNR